MDLVRVEKRLRDEIKARQQVLELLVRVQEAGVEIISTKFGYETLSLEIRWPNEDTADLWGPIKHERGFGGSHNNEHADGAVSEYSDGLITKAGVSISVVLPAGTFLPPRFQLDSGLGLVSSRGTLWEES